MTDRDDNLTVKQEPNGRKQDGTESALQRADEPIDTAPATVPTYSLSPRRIAMFATAVATAALTTLAVVASVEGAQALSTIALVLAILAFVMQILLFVFHSQAAHEQRVRSEQLNAQTRALLAEVQATAQATQAMVSQQFNQLLQAFVSGATTTAEQTKFDPATFEHRLLSNIRSAILPQSPSSGRDLRPPTRPRGEADDRRRESSSSSPREASPEAIARLRARRGRLNKLQSFPTENEAREAIEILGKLSPQQRFRLQQLGNDEVDSKESGTYVGLERVASDDELERAGLVTEARVSTGDGRQLVMRLTDHGIDAARLFTALGDVPAWARSVLSVEDPAGGSTDDDIPF